MPWFTFQSPANTTRAKVIATDLLKEDYNILCLEKVFRRGRVRRCPEPLRSDSIPVRSGQFEVL